MHERRKKPTDRIPLVENGSIQNIRNILLDWGRRNYSDFPWRSTSNPFHALIAEVMLQRTRAEQVGPVFTAFVSRYPSTREASKEKPENIRKLLKTLGLNWRAEKIIGLIERLENQGGAVPATLDALLCLPGVGQYAASSYLSLHAGVRMPIVDSNVVRLWSRIFGFKADHETRRKRWFLELADRITPQDAFRDFNYAVLDFTRMVCRPKPVHSMCPLADICKYYRRAC